MRLNDFKALEGDRHRIPYVIAYREIIAAPDKVGEYGPTRCDVIYDGRISPDFYGGVFPHGKSASVGMGSMVREVDVKQATADLGVASGLADCETIREEGAPIPLKPLGMRRVWSRRVPGRGYTMPWQAGALRPRQLRRRWPRGGSRTCGWRVSCS